LTLGIALAGPAESEPWGWWDDGDSLARPQVFEDSLDRREGRVRLSTRSAPGGSRSLQAYDAAVREGPWRISLAGRDDSGFAPVRQRVSWEVSGLRLTAGDLAPWSDAPLLEGSSEASRANHRLARLGSGHAPSGIDSRATSPDDAPVPVALRSRFVAGPASGSRSSLLLELGDLRLGASKSSSGPLLPLAGLDSRGEGARFAAARAGGPDAGAGSANLELRAGPVRQNLSITKIDRDFRHDGLPRGWRGSTGVQADARWAEERTEAGLGGEVREDSSAVRTWNVLGQGSLRAADIRWRVRARWSRSRVGETTRTLGGAGWERGVVRPWFELGWTLRSNPEPAFGVWWNGRDLQVSASAIRRTSEEWEWKAASSLGLERSDRGSRVELECAQTGGATRGGGSWLVRW